MHWNVVKTEYWNHGKNLDVLLHKRNDLIYVLPVRP